MARGWKINSQKVVLTNSGTLLIALHPFYELNGRTLRLFVDMLCMHSNYLPIDYSQAITNGAYIEASIECVQYADQSKMEKILMEGLKQNM
jgi:cell filamentation protein